MPLTPFQRRVLATLAGNRSEASHFAGGLVLTVDDESPRFSHDFDIFREASEEVVRASERDVATLLAAGFEVEKLSRDEKLGWRLHRFDLAINKALALSARSESRDYVDILELGKLFPLAAICWAAPGKDPGFSPLSLLKMMLRVARIWPEQLEEIRARALDPIELKEAWVATSDRAWTEIERVADQQPDLPIGIAFVDDRGHAGWIGADPTRRHHPPSLRGCWPEVRPLESS